MDAKGFPWPLLGLFVVAACNPAGQAGGDAESPAPDPNGLLTNLAVAGSTALDPAEAEARARAALAQGVADAATIRLRKVRSGAAGAVCGELEREGGFRGFIVPPDGPAVIARSEGLKLDDWDDPYPGLYIRWCASSDELIALQSELSTLPPVPPPPAEPVPLAPAPPIAMPETVPVRPPAAEGEARRFSEAVLRPDGE